MYFYYLMVARPGSMPVVVWEGDDDNAATTAYERAFDDPANGGAYVMLASRKIGRYRIPDDDERVSGG